LIYNITDLLGLGININGIAVEAWKSYLDTYNMLSKVTLANVEQELWNMMYIDEQNFTVFISQLCTKWTIAIVLGIQDNFVELFSSVLGFHHGLYTTKSSHDAINHLMSHWARVSWTQAVNPYNAATALHINGNNVNQQYYNQHQYTNPKCNRCKHTIKNCYWPGMLYDGK